MNAEHETLRKLAEAATAGPWSPMWQNSRGRDHCWQTPVCVGEGARQGNVFAIVHMGGAGAVNSTKETVEANAAYIAAASPDVILALLARVEALETALEPFAELANSYDGVLDEPHDLAMKIAALPKVSDLRRARAARRSGASS